MIKNKSLEYIEGYGDVKWFDPKESYVEISEKSKNKKLYEDLNTVIDLLIEDNKLKNGCTVSFHHHLRNGDGVVNQVMKLISEKGLKDIRMVASGIFKVHEPILEYIDNGTITQIVTSTFNRGPVADAISYGKMKKPCIMMTHGGRARAILDGDIKIDVAFIAAPSSDELGNLNGISGPNACGVISYAYADAQCADTVVAITDYLVPYPNEVMEITQEKVDYVVKVDSIGESSGIESGTTKITEDPIKRKIAANAAKLIEELGMVKEGMSFQTGASSTSLAVADYVKKMMIDKGVRGSFALGGIHSFMVGMLKDDLFEALLDVQCFDLAAVESIRQNERHQSISASLYANPNNKGAVVSNLDTVVLGATEIDLDFNVNVTTASNGMIMGASGGHSDCAAGSKLAIVVANLTRKTFCSVRENVTTITTPGRDIDVLVTEHGIAINPLRTDIIEKLKDSELDIVTIQSLKEKGESLVGEQEVADTTDKIVGIVQYRDGSVMDLVYQVR